MRMVPLRSSGHGLHPFERGWGVAGGDGFLTMYCRNICLVVFGLPFLRRQCALRQSLSGPGRTAYWVHGYPFTLPAPHIDFTPSARPCNAREKQLCLDTVLIYLLLF